MVKDKKKLAFTIAETLICMFILSIFIVLSMKVFTKKHQKPTYNPSHGYYMCYRDSAGRIMKKIGTAECGYYYDKRADEHLIIIKRHDIVCTIFLYNIENGNVVDNILNTIELTDGEKVHNHVENTYRIHNFQKLL